MASVRIENLQRSFGKVRAVDGVCLEIREGEFFALLGPSGCGKTTILRSIAGFETPDAGGIYIGDRLMNPLPPHLRPCGMVFQSYALFPHMTIFDNVAYGLYAHRYQQSSGFGKLGVLARIFGRRFLAPEPDVVERVQKALAMVELDGYQHRFPSQLSGGQQQRVALARALVVEPQVLLLDEPLSNLDRRLRVTMRTTIRDIQKRVGITTIFVTHDQEEAMSMADTVAVMKDGKIQQIGAPHEIYGRPQSAFVAQFLGQANSWPGRVLSTKDDEAVIAVSERVRLTTRGSRPSGSNPHVIVRPENIRLQPAEGHAGNRLDADWNILQGVVVNRTYLGPVIQYVVKVTDVEFIVDRSSEEPILNEGDRVTLGIPPERVLVV